MPEPTALRLAHYPAGTRMSPHVHEEPSIGIVVRGAFVERIGTRERDYASGQIACLPAGVAHSQRFGEAWGFSSHSHPCREFRAQFGLTPSQYRRSAG